MSGGRVELGVGSGTDPAIFAASGKGADRRREDNTAGVIQLRDAFAGQALGPGGLTLQPPAPSLGARLWQAAFSEDGARSEEYFELLHISYGSPEEVAVRLASDRVLAMSSDLLCQFSPAAPPLGEAIAALELMATQVAPALGSKPAARPAPALA